ncbi:uncharacterized protein LOC112572732 isoform X2 [Pomacea canaliculata]|nr:uncharacterized protein LOC112572732 isoform X2 [Pomacea canaliculata]
MAVVTCTFPVNISYFTVSFYSTTFGGSPGVIISCDRCSVEPRFQKLITLKFPDTTKEGDTWKFEVQRSKETAGIYTCLGLRGAASFHSTPCNITDTPEEYFLSSSTTTDAPAGRLYPSQNKGIDSLYALFVIPIVCGLIVIILYRKPCVRKAVMKRMTCTRGRNSSEDQSTQMDRLHKSGKVREVLDQDS